MKKFIIVITAVVLVAFVWFFFYSKPAVSPATTENEGQKTETKNEAPNPITTGTGRVVFAVTDAAIGLEEYSSIILSISEIRLQSAAKGWITVSEDKKQFDLLALKRSGLNALLADVTVDAGNYNQIRLSVDKITVIEKDGATSEAKLPSKDLRILGKLAVLDGKISSVLFDFLADKSLHMTGAGQRIFAPVIKLETRNNVNVAINGNLVQFSEGAVSTDTTVGMNESGAFETGTGLDPKATLDVIGDTIRLISPGDSGAGITITAKGAVDKSVGEGYLTSALSVKMVTREAKKAWLVTGLKGLDIKNIYIDAATGSVMAVE